MILQELCPRHRHKTKAKKRGFRCICKELQSVARHIGDTVKERASRFHGKAIDGDLACSLAFHELQCIMMGAYGLAAQVDRF